MSVLTTKRFRRLGAALSAVALIVTMSACGSEGGEAKGIKLVKADQLTTCTHLPYEPFQFQKDGKIVGFEVDLVGLLAKDLGVEHEVVNLGSWEQVTSGKAFEAEECDIGMGAMSITPERQKALTITKPYFKARQVLLVKKGSGIKSLADLKGKKVGGQADTTGEAYIKSNAEKFGFEPVRNDDLALQTAALKAGKIQGAVNDNGPLYDFVNKNPDYEVVQTFNTGDLYGFCAKGKNDPNAKKLIDRMNKVLADAKKSQEYQKIYKKWFKVEAGAESFL